jgi:hypothetical protein
MTDAVLDAPSNGASDTPMPDAAGASAAAAPAQASTEKPAASAREAIERAMATMDVGEKPAGEAKPAGDRTRDPATGQFKPKAGDLAAAAPVPKPGEKLASEVIAVDPLAKPTATPAPAGFTKAAQDAWAATPEPVRADVERRIGELMQGMEKYKGEVAAFEPVRKFDEMARAGGTTLDKALTAYVGIEDAWRADPARGFVEVAKNFGVDPMALLNDIGMRLTGGQQPKAGDNSEVAALKRELAQLRSELGGEVGTIKQTFEEQKKAARERDAQSVVDAFAKDPAHPHFAALEESIAHMLETGFAKNLQDAYDKAVRLSPEIAARIEAEKAAKAASESKPEAQTRKASLSVTGAPSPGSNPTTRKPPGSIRESLTTALAQVGT